jgi:hypothetical protein
VIGGGEVGVAVAARGVWSGETVSIPAAIMQELAAVVEDASVAAPDLPSVSAVGQELAATVSPAVRELFVDATARAGSRDGRVCDGSTVLMLVGAVAGVRFTDLRTVAEATGLCSHGTLFSRRDTLAEARIVEARRVEENSEGRPSTRLVLSRAALAALGADRQRLGQVPDSLLRHAVSG